MDDSGTEHESGWVLVRDGSSRRSAGGAPPAADEVVDLGGAVVTPGLVNTHHHLYQTLTRARAQEATLFEWLRELYPVWARIDAEAEYAAARTGLAELALSGCTTVFDHHYVFPRGRSGLWEAEVQAARELGVRIVASRGSMDLGESRTAGCRRTRWSRRSTRCSPTPSGSPGCQDDGRDGAARGRAVLAVLGHEGADGRVGGARAAARPAAAHPSRGDGRGGRLLPGAVRLHARSSTWASSAGSPGTSGARTASISRRRTSPRSARAGVGVAHCPTSNLRLGAGVAPGAGAGRRGRAGRARRRRLGVERAHRPLLRGQAGAARRARARRAARDDRAARRCASARAAARRCSGATTSARSRRASAPTSRSGAPTASSSAAPSDPVAGLVLSAPHRVDRLYVGGEDVVRDGHLVRADEDEIAREHRVQASASPGVALDGAPPWKIRAVISTHVLDTGAGEPGRRRARRALPRRRARRLAARPTTTAGSASSPTWSRATYRLVFHPDSPFFRRVEVEIEIEAGRDYHVPLLLSPYACAIYRGS